MVVHTEPNNPHMTKITSKKEYLANKQKIGKETKKQTKRKMTKVIK